MKRLVALIIALFAAVIVTNAQSKSDASDHLTFKGVPINGTLQEFIQKMKKAGFNYKRTSDGIALLEGDFASYKQCTLAVWTSKPKNLVSRIGVIFSEHNDWSSLSSNYFDLKEMLTQKYGEPSNVVEKFQSYTPESDLSKLTSVKLGECKYHTIYEMDKGKIKLSIANDGSRCYVALVYFDKINNEEVMKDALDDL